MRRRWTTTIIGLTVAAASHLATAGQVEGRVAPETGGRHQGSRIAASPGVFSSHTCVVKEDGTVRCWGANDSGQLGNGAGGPGRFETTPVRVSNVTDAVSVAAGSSHTCVVRAGGTVVCWGANGSGQLGNGNNAAQPSPVSVLNPDGTTLAGVVGITAGRFHTCATRVDGTVRCWGSNSAGRLGTGSTMPSTSSFALTVTNLADAVSVSAGDRHSCATRVNGTVRCWGSNHFAQLGIGTADDNSHATPADVRNADGSLLNEVVAVASGGFHTCVIRTNGQVRCWGNNDFGQVTGDGTTAETRLTPTTVSGIGGAVVLGLGTFHSCVRRSDGDLRCWGRNADGQLGELSTVSNPPDPVTVVDSRTGSPLSGCVTAPLLNADALTAGERHTCSLQIDEKIRCWGDNASGQLGNPDPPLFATATVSGSGGTMGARAIVAGVTDTCARRADGTVACWNSSDLTPAAVPGFTAGRRRPTSPIRPRAS